MSLLPPEPDVPDADLDEHGQPEGTIYSRRVDARLLAEMMGICRGILYDGRVVDEEVAGLAHFLELHPHIHNQFPASLIAKRLNRILADRVVDEAERTELREILETLVPMQSESAAEFSTAACFDNPPPPLFFDGHKWVVTGRFAFGNRVLVTKEITDRGGRVYDAVGGWIDYVVVGEFASPAWKYGQWGNKIADAMELRTEGHKIAIVSERHWRETIELYE
jgi:NAD-dependent DNA ligase